jgi:hypothetical protein
MTTATAVPTDPRTAAFRELAVDTLDHFEGSAAIDIICVAFQERLNGLDAQLRDTGEELRNALHDARMRSELLGYSHDAASRELATAGKLNSQLSHAQTVISQIRALVESADTGPGAVDTEDLRAALARPILPTVEDPQLVTFVPDRRFAGGHFGTPDQVVHRALPFMGWGTVYRPRPGGPMIEPVFLMEARLAPATTVEAETGMRFLGIVA